MPTNDKKREPRPASNTGNGIGLVHRKNHQLENSSEEIIIWEEGNPCCLVNLLPEKISDAVKSLTPEICNLTEAEHSRQHGVSDILEQLRLSFWDEYFLTSDEAQGVSRPRKMRMEAIYPRLCSREHFYKNIVENPRALSYLIKPPRNYMIKMRSMLERGHQRFEEILAMDLRDDNGRVDTKLIGQLIKIVTLIENRVRGSVAHKIELNSKSVSLNANYETPKTFQGVEAELKQIERDILQLNGNPDGELKEALEFEVDVTPKEELT